MNIDVAKLLKLGTGIREKERNDQLNEAEKKKKVKNLTLDVAVTPSELQKRPEWTLSQDDERRRLRCELDSVQSTIDVACCDITQAETELTQAETSLNDSRSLNLSQLLDVQCETDHYKTQLNDTADQISIMKRRLDYVRKEIDQKANILSAEIKCNEDFRSEVKILQQDSESYLLQYEELPPMVTLLEERLATLTQKNQDQSRQNQLTLEQNALTQREISTLNEDNKKVQMQSEVTEKKIIEMETERQGYELECERWTVEEKFASIELAHARKQASIQKQQSACLKRELDTLNREANQSGKESELIDGIINGKETSLRTLGIELVNVMSKVESLKRSAERLVNERESYEENFQKHQQQHILNMEEITMCDQKISELQQKNDEMELRLKRQHRLCNAVQLEMNVKSNRLLEVKTLIDEKRRHLKWMAVLSSRSISEITKEEDDLSREESNQKRLEKDLRHLEMDVSTIKQTVLELTAKHSLREDDVRKLLQDIGDAEKEKLDLEKECSSMKSDHNDLLSKFAIMSGDIDAANMKRKFAISDLHNGEVRYRDLDREIHALSTELHALEEDTNDFVQHTANYGELTKQCYALEKQVQMERAACVALQDESSRPLNVHRWRTLESAEPERYDMISYIQDLKNRHSCEREVIAKLDQSIDYSRRQISILTEENGRSTELSELEKQLQHHKASIQDKNEKIKLLEKQLDESRKNGDSFLNKKNNIKGKTRFKKKL